MIKNGMFFGGHGYERIHLIELDYSNQRKKLIKWLNF